MKVLIIPEDPTLDQYILKPIVESIFRDVERSARVHVLSEPHLRGVDQALDKDVVAGIVADNPMVDLFLIVVDRDCVDSRNDRAQAREQEHPDSLRFALAVEEVEVWMLALHRDDLGARWSDVRAHCDPKEEYAEPFLERQGWSTEVGRGRKKAMRNLAGNWRGLLGVCSEIGDLKREIEMWLGHQVAEQQP